MRPPGTAQELERRRRRGIQLLKQRHSQAEVARILGVRECSVHRWRKMAKRGDKALAAKPHPGRGRGMTDGQHRQLEKLLLQGATTHGWPHELWTAARVTQVIRRHFGIRYHPEHVRKILKQRLGWSSQKPELHARERDEAELERWQREEFPRIKKSRA